MTNRGVPKQRCDGPLLLLAVALMAIFTPSARGQANASSALPQTAVADGKSLVFDVVSIKVNKSGNAHGMLSMEPGGDGLTVVNVTMQRIVQFAYNFRRDELVFGAPDWARSERYDVVAKVAGEDLDAYHNLTDWQRRQMLQVVFADRCKMKAHREPKEIPIYALVVSKNGPKMREAKPGDPVPDTGKGPNGQPTHEDALYRTRGQLRGEQVPMASLALALSTIGVGRQVVDKTGLTGKYYFTLQWDPDQDSSLVSESGGQPDPAHPSDAPGPSIFTAIQEQLGLKLEGTKGLVECLVIDHLERPSEN